MKMTASGSRFVRNSVILGTGGETPGVLSIQAETLEWSTLLTLKEGQSVYALDADPTSSLIAAGTRTGEVYLIGPLSISEPDGNTQSRQHFQGAPVVSVCIVDHLSFVSTDSLGRCLLWQSNNPGSTPKHLETDGSAIVSLLRTSDQHVVGLSSKGMLFTWEIPTGKLLSQAAGPAPPKKGALVKLVSWPRTGTIAYPTHNGNLAQYIPSNREVISHTAHRGDFYGIQTWGDYLVTAGMEDGVFRVWRGNKESPELEFSIPKDIVSIAGIGTHPDTFLLIDQDGRSWLATFPNGRLEPMNQFDNHIIRCAAGPTYEQLSEFQQESRRVEADRISQEIYANTSCGPNGDLEALHARLVELGYEHVSLLHRAEQAARHGNLIQELDSRARLMRLIPTNQPSSVCLFAQYADLLWKVFRFQEACDIYDLIAHIEPSHENLHQAEQKREWSNAFESGSCILETDLPLPSLVSAADADGKPFTGTFLLSRLDPLPCRGAIVTGESLVQKYEQIRRETPHLRLPTPHTSQAHHFSPSIPRKGEFVFFGKNGDSHPHGLRFALQLSNDGLQTVATPLVLLEIPPSTGDETIATHNKTVMENLHRIFDQDLSQSWLTKVFDSIRYTLRRTIAETRATSDSHREAG